MAEPLTRSRRMRWPHGACLLDICISPGVHPPSLTAAHALCTSTTRTSPEAPAGSAASTLDDGSRPCLNAAETTPAQPAGPPGVRTCLACQAGHQHRPHGQQAGAPAGPYQAICQGMAGPRLLFGSRLSTCW